MSLTAIKRYFALFVAAVGAAFLTTLFLFNLPALLHSIQLPTCAIIDDNHQAVTTCKAGLGMASVIMFILDDLTGTFESIGLKLSSSSWSAELGDIDKSQFWYHGHALDLNGVAFGYRLMMPWSWTPSASQAAVFTLALIVSSWLLRRLWGCSDSSAPPTLRYQ